MKFRWPYLESLTLFYQIEGIILPSLVVICLPAKWRVDLNVGNSGFGLLGLMILRKAAMPNFASMPLL